MAMEKKILMAFKRHRNRAVNMITISREMAGTLTAMMPKEVVMLPMI